jgi:hypothetical protein
MQKKTTQTDTHTHTQTDRQTHTHRANVRLELLRTDLLNIWVFWHVTPCRLVVSEVSEDRNNALSPTSCTMGKDGFIGGKGEAAAWVLTVYLHLTPRLGMTIAVYAFMVCTGTNLTLFYLNLFFVSLISLLPKWSFSWNLIQEVFSGKYESHFLISFLRLLFRISVCFKMLSGLYFCHSWRLLLHLTKPDWHKYLVSLIPSTPFTFYLVPSVKLTITVVAYSNVLGSVEIVTQSTK